MKKRIYYLIVADFAMGILALLMFFVSAATGIYLFELIAFAMHIGVVTLFCLLSLLFIKKAMDYERID